MRTHDSDFVEEIRDRFNELTNSQRKIAEAMVRDREWIAFATVEQFSNRLGVSPSTVVRFANRLGFDGYPGLQERIRDSIRARLSQAQEAAVVGGEALAGTAFLESLQHDSRALARTIDNLKREDLDAAVELISSVDRLYVIGSMTTIPVADYSTITLNRIRGNCLQPPLDAGRLVSHLVQVRPEDGLLAFTFPRYAAMTVRAIEAVRRVGARVLVISDSPFSPAARQADVVLTCETSGFVGTENSLVAAMAVMNALLTGVIQRHRSEALERYSRGSEMMIEWDAFLLKGGHE